jgi:MYXO-CTERM domain-containing protein
VHFDYTAGGTIDLRSESVLAFQKLWNLNNPGAKIAEDGDYGPITGSKIAASPATGFAKGSTCMPQTTPNTPPDPKFAAELGQQSMPQALAAGEVQPAWVEFKNTGTETWEPGVTRLGTTDPQDRESALAAPDWISANRAATVDAETKPGETGRFTFSLRGPVVTAPEALTEHFGLVQEGVSWFPAAASLTVDVMVSPAAVPSGDPNESTEGGVTPTAPGPMGAHGGCSVAGHDGAPATGVALLVVALTLFVRRRASYPSGRCRASVGSSSFWPSRSR